MDNINTNELCSLCCEKIDFKYHLIKLPCGHYFHAIKRTDNKCNIPEWIKNNECLYSFLIAISVLSKKNHPNCDGIQKWLKIQKTCPICRYKIENYIFNFI